MRLHIILVLSFLLLNPSHTIADPSSLNELDSQVQAITEVLAEGVSGIKSSSAFGGINWVTPEVCAELTECYGTNPNSPYGVINLPLAEGEPPLPNPSLAPGGDLPGMHSIWQLRSDEAVVFLGWTPKDVKYFGFTPYLMTRMDRGSSEVKTIFGAFADTLNQLVIKTDGDAIAGSNTFGKFTAIILTSDSNADSRIRLALASQGIADSSINTIVIPSDFPIYQGWETNSDTLGFLIRLGIPLNKETVNTYMKDTPIRVVRVTPTSIAPTVTLATPSLRKQGTGKCEGKKNLSSGCGESIDINLERTFETITREIVGRFKSKGSLLKKLKPFVVPYGITAKSTAGKLCADTGVNCNADNRDTIYSFDVSDATLSQDSKDFFLYIGVNHVGYGKATYFNHAVYRKKTSAGVVGFSDKDIVSDGMSSIEYFLGRPAKNPTEKNLFAYKISRSCNNEPFCLEVPTTGTPAVPLDEPMVLMGRIYLEPETKVKPSEREILYQKLYRAQP